jgi:hypothetical protein
MLFILAMDPLQRLLDKATQQGVLANLPLATTRWRTSMYVDDAAIFINPLKEDLKAITTILQEFGRVSGLHINLLKSSVHPIRCQDIDLDHVLASFAGTREPSRAAIWVCICVLDHCRRSMCNPSLSASARGCQVGKARC